MIGTPDGPAHAEQCTFCRGTATVLKWEPMMDVALCENAKLCALTQTYEHMIRGVRSA